MTVLDPIILSQNIDLPLAEFELLVPEDLFYLQGHFPEEPVLPGVVQIDWAISLARSVFSLMPDFLGLESLKFHRIIKPLTQLKLVLEHAETSGKLQFSYTSDAGQHSQGRVQLGQR